MSKSAVVRALRRRNNFPLRTFHVLGSRLKFTNYISTNL
jgi:hypothetical protein